MTENMLLRAVLDDLKAGSHPASMSNRRKCELGERFARGDREASERSPLS